MVSDRFSVYPGGIGAKPAASVDGNVLARSGITKSGEGLRLHVHADDLLMLRGICPAELLEYRKLAALVLYRSYCDGLVTISYEGVSRRYPAEYVITARIHLNAYQWTNPISVTQTVQILKEVLSGQEGTGQEAVFIDSGNSAAAVMYPWSQNSDFLEIVASVEGKLWPTVEDAIEQARLKAIPEALVTHFRFPQPVQTACIQYLSYFGQFLRDIGIKADSTIEQRATEVLFSVTPADGIEALDRVREALNVYIQLPEAPSLAEFGNSDIAVMQLEANVDHLRSQLRLANATIMAHQAQMSLQAAQLEQLMLHSPQLGHIAISPSDDDQSVAVAGGLIKIRELEGKGFAVDLPEIVRRLRRRLG